MPKAKINLLLPSDSSDFIFQPVYFLADSHGRWMNNHVIVSSILPRYKEGSLNDWYNDRVRYINRHLHDQLLAEGIAFIDHTSTFLKGKYKVKHYLFAQDGLHMNAKGKDHFAFAIRFF